MYFRVNECTFLQEGYQIMGWMANPHWQNDTTLMRRFRSAYGINPYVCNIVWSIIVNNNSQEFSTSSVCPKHLLWTLLFLRQYNSSEVNSAITGADEKTFRKYTWEFIYYLANMDLVSN